jgi:hypothetical protein
MKKRIFQDLEARGIN